jgi:hypothetical protein
MIHVRKVVDAGLKIVDRLGRALDGAARLPRPTRHRSSAARWATATTCSIRAGRAFLAGLEGRREAAADQEAGLVANRAELVPTVSAVRATAFATSTTAATASAVTLSAANCERRRERGCRPKGSGAGGAATTRGADAGARTASRRDSDGCSRRGARRRGDGR